MNPITFAIIGASGVTRNHVASLRACPPACPVCLHSRDAWHGQRIAAECGLRFVADYEEILRNKDIAAVSILTEPHRHASLAMDALRNDKHVLLEKPIDVDLERAIALVDLAGVKKNLAASVISQNRFDPCYISMREKVLAGMVGTPFLLEIRMFWRRASEYYAQGNGWRGTYGGVLLNQAVHYLDLALWFFGEPEDPHAKLLKTRPEISCPDTASISIRFACGPLLHMACTTACAVSEPVIFNIYGPLGTLRYEEERLAWQAKQPESMEKPEPGASSYVAQIKDFLQAIMEKRPPLVTFQDGLNVLRLIKELQAESSLS